MTNEEAIKYIEMYRSCGWESPQVEFYMNQAIDMAIEALKQPETTAFATGLSADMPLVEYAPVIRCKDCKHYNDGDCEEMPKLVSADDYCSWAERREE